MTTTTKSKKASRPKAGPKVSAERKALVDSLFGSMSWMKLTVDDYLREKHAETDAENDT